MAAGVSSPPCQAYLDHPLSATSTTTTIRNPSAAFNSPISTSTSSSSPTSLREHEHESSPSFSSGAASNSTLSLPASDCNGLNRSRHSLSLRSSSSSFSTPATSPIPPHSPLEPVAESRSSSSLASASSASLNRHKSPQQHQLGIYSARLDPKTQRSAGFFSFAASAIDRTQSAIATKSESSLRHKRSLSRLSITADFTALPRGPEPSPDKASRYRPASVISSPSSVSARSPTFQQGSKLPSTQASLAPETPYSQPYSQTDASQPPPIRLPRINNKMHQTSSRLLRMTDDDRPFTKVSHL